MPSHASPNKRALSSPAPSPARAKGRRFNAPAPVLDHSAYPHILDKVLAVATWPSLLALRTTCRDVRDRIDARLFSHVTLREQCYDYKEARHSYNDWYSPSRVELRDADGHRLPGVRWEEDMSWAERVDAAFRMRRFTRTVDIVDDLSLDDQVALPQAELRALPDERRAVVRAHDGNLLRVALSGLDGMRVFDVSTTCSLPVKTSVQYSAFETSWDGYHPDPCAIFCSTHTDPLDKLVIVLQWDPALKLLENSVVMWGEERNRTNSFYRHRNRACEPREVVLVLRHDTRHMPDLRLGDIGRRIDNDDAPEQGPGEYGMLSTVVDWIGEKLGMVDKITLVGLDTVLPHIAGEERGEELHDAIRESARERWERVFLTVTDKAEYQSRLHNDDLYVGQLQSHPEFYRIAMTEYWKVMQRNRQMQGWGDFQFAMGDNGFNFTLDPTMFGLDDDFDSDDDMDSDSDDMDGDEDDWEDMDDDASMDDSVDGDGPPFPWFMGGGPSFDPYLGDSDASVETVGESDVEDDDDDGDDGEDSDSNGDSDSDADFGPEQPHPVAALAMAFQQVADNLSALTGPEHDDDSLASTAPTTPNSFRLPTPPSPPTIWADEVRPTKADDARRRTLSERVHKASKAMRAGKPVDTESLRITLDEWYFMANYSRKRLPCTESQLDPEELAALSLTVVSPSPMVRNPATIEFMSYKEYEEAVGKEAYKWEMDGYEWKAHEGCSCNAAPLEETFVQL